MYSKVFTDSKSLSTLRRTGFALGALSVLFLVLTHRFLEHFWDAWSANRWLAFSLCLMLFLLWTFWRNLPHNYRQDGQPILPSLGIGNSLTFLRGALIAATAGFIVLPLPSGWLEWVPALFYTLASLGDFMDGYLARRQDRATHLGEILDMYVDGIGVLVASLLLVQYGKVPVWYLLVGLARYLFLGGLWLRQRLGIPTYELLPSETRRILAAVQMVLMFILLWPVFSPPATVIAVSVFAIPFLVNFVHDWLFVSGRIKSRVLPPSRFQGWMVGWFPLILRMAVFVLTLVSSSNHFLTFISQAETYAIIGFPAPQTALALFVLLEFALSVLLLIGFAGRAAALTGLVLIGLQSNFIPLTFPHTALIVLYATLFHLGTGLFSLWKPEDRLIGLRTGRPPQPFPTGTIEKPKGARLNPGSPLSEIS